MKTVREQHSGWRRELENRYVLLMMVGLKRALSFAWKWRGGATGIQEDEVEIQRGDRSVPATLVHPNYARSPLPGWVVLHGVTRPGRSHPMLLRFVRALAGTGAAELNGVGSISFVCMRDRNYLSEILSSGESFETIVVDPPRAGMGKQISKMLGRIGAHRIVYVSCNPFSLARDLACLISSGYIVTEIQPLDMFPQTDHIETLVLLERKGSQR